MVGGGHYPDTMEHGRDASLRLVGQYGLQPPPSFAFTNADEALAFVGAGTDFPASPLRRYEALAATGYL